MRESIQYLLDLQKLDDDLIARTEEFEAQPGLAAAAEQVREAVLAQGEAAKLALEAEELARRNAESAVRDAEALLQRLEGQQGQVKSNDAYRALLSEIEAAKNSISEQETAVLESMETIDAARQRKAQVDAEIAETTDRLDGEGREREERRQTLEKEISALRGSRDEVASKVESGLLARYEKISLRRRPAIVVLTGELCTGCRVGIPPQLYNQMLEGLSVVACQSCQRLLIADRWLKDEV